MRVTQFVIIISDFKYIIIEIIYFVLIVVINTVFKKISEYRVPRYLSLLVIHVKLSLDLCLYYFIIPITFSHTRNKNI